MAKGRSAGAGSAAARNVRLYPWFKFFQNLIFWQAVWFLFFQSELSAAEAVLLYALYDVSTTAFEVPSGYMSDRLGRRITLIGATIAGALGAGLIAVGGGFVVFACAQVLLGISASFASGTDSALLYESLAEDNRQDEIEAHETRAWQFTLGGLALSAITGGLLAQWSFAAAFAGGALAMTVALMIALRFSEPAHASDLTRAGISDQWQLFRDAMAKPVLVWLFALSVLMYGFSHLPFVFGQPFIAQALGQIGWRAEAPMVSGTVTTIMMITSAFATLFAIRLRKLIGLPAILLIAFAIQIAIITALAIAPSMLVIAVLFLRMVPDSLARPFIVARMQPLLNDAGRATYLSMQSFAGRLLFAGSLLLVSANVSARAEMDFADISTVLGWYAVVGIACIAILLATVRRAGIDQKDTSRG